jgi:hypothetical protein
MSIVVVVLAPGFMKSVPRFVGNHVYSCNKLRFGKRHGSRGKSYEDILYETSIIENDGSDRTAIRLRGSSDQHCADTTDPSLAKIIG